MQRFFPFQLRSIPSPTVSLPIACRSVGHYRAFPGWRDQEKVKPFVELFWGIHGSGEFAIGGTTHTLHPGEVLVLYPGDNHRIIALDHWQYRWFTLDGALPAEVVRALGLERQPQPAGRCPEELFERLTGEIEDVTPQGQRAASATAYEILTLAFAQMTNTHPPMRQVRQCLDLIRERHGRADLNVTALAEEIGIGRTTLSKRFREHMRISPIDYLTSYRVSRAVKLLRESDLPVADIARQSGFARGNYLTRVVRKHTGLTAREIRARGGI